MTEPRLMHATAVAIAGRAVLLRGASGSGKSDLALRLIDAGAELIADDQSELTRDGETILVRAPAPIAGLFEVRGLGIVKLERCAGAPLALIADLVVPERVERLPQLGREPILGVAIPVIALAPFEVSAAAKLRLALAAFSGPDPPTILPV